MKNLLVMKTIVDGYSIKLCGSFGKIQELLSNEKCVVQAESKKVSIYLSEKEILQYCENFKQKCFLHLRVSSE